MVERSTRYTRLVHLPREERWRQKPAVKNAPALAGYEAITMKNRLTETMSTLPVQLRRSLTWDPGKEMSVHAEFNIESGIPVFFAYPHSPGQRANNENSNGLLRQYAGKRTDLSRWTTEDLDAVAFALNTRPRRTLVWKAPIEPLDEHLDSLHQPVLLPLEESGQGLTTPLPDWCPRVAAVVRYGWRGPNSSCSGMSGEQG